ncbi:MAG: hypothetical protein ABJC19_06325 [Gemmatimonadota bacterium]
MKRAPCGLRRALLPLLLVAVPLGAQSWRLRFDAAAQRVAFRGITADSVLESRTLTGPEGGPVSPDGFAVNCFNETYCHFYRPGEIRRGLPAALSTDLTMWGLGVPGLRVRVHARLNTDFSGKELWPGTTPRLQFAEAFAEYIRGGLMVRAGRLLDQGRLGNAGLGIVDGARATLRPEQLPLEFALYGGWGLARGSLLAVTSPAVNPLLDYAPTTRQIVAGGSIAARLPRLDAQVEYRREIDPITDYLVAERAGLSASYRPLTRMSLSVGADYDLAQGNLGTAEATLAYSAPRLWITVGARHYRPYFDLWTVWGVFSPVPYRGVNGSVAVGVVPRVQLRARGEWFRYDASATSTPTVTIEDRGWRAGLEATWSATPTWTVQGNVHREKLPGASSQGLDARVTWQVRPPLAMSFEGGGLERPLEFRFQDASLRWLGASASYRVADRWQVSATADQYWESRVRADPASLDWNQWRLGLRASVTLRSDADRWQLPPGRLP